MNESTLGRIAPLAGAGYAVAMIAGDLVIGQFPDSDASVSKLTTYYANHHAHVVAGGMVFSFATILLAVFGCALWSRARTIRPGVAVAILVATAVAVVADVQEATSFSLVGHASTASTLTPSALQALHIVGSEGSLSTGVAILLLAVGLADIAPRWLAWPAVVLGIAQLVPGISFFASLLFLLWAAVTGVVLTVLGGALLGDGFEPAADLVHVGAEVVDSR
jgi:hypothetical protein